MRTPIDNEKNQLLLAFKGKNTRVPVWFMRQAGRYLPQYQALKSQQPLRELFRNPELAGAITLQPVEILKVDAAILFADILTMPSGMGFNIDFVDGKGPVVSNAICQQEDIKHFGKFSGLEHVTQTIKLINALLPSSISLIGFAGSPYTVLTYLCPKHAQLMFEDSKLFHQWMQLLTKNTITYLKQQQSAGIKCYQLFDTWAGSLRWQEYKTFVLPYVQQIFKSIDLPSIYYLKNSHHLFDLMQQSGADVLSVCETIDIGKINIKQGLQGNFLNTMLYASDEVIEKETLRLLKLAKAKHRKYIFNLSHGVMPNVNPLKLQRMVEIIHEFKWK
jgi:uroporphyrinogen decarboxylase